MRKGIVMTRIIGRGVYVPARRTNEDFEEKYGKKAKAISRLINHEVHYLATDIESREVNISNVGMALNAAKQAIQNAKLANEDIDLIIYSTSTPDYLLPPSYILLQKELKIKNCMGFDIRSGCAGFGTALTLADKYIKTGECKNALVVGADLISSRFTKFPAKELDMKTLFNYMFFGDCAGAVVLTGSDEDRGIISTKVESTMADVDMGSAFYVGGALHPYPSEEVDSEKWAAYQATGLSEEYLSKVLIETFEEFQNESGVDLSEIDRFIMPIESEKIAKRVFERFPEITPDKICSNHSEGGALINAAIPVAINSAIENEKLKKNEKVLIYAAENTQWQHAIIFMKW
ncbi:3-oxoacyl-[acyl-carrier-protein] synthase-3 [Pseudobutyrivibrio sp. NOR37]|uniref:Beta-ketoacyl-[acyl-carrier-protein] synthase III n=2 Tax=Lachnospiraceae TaxID=186803 RepID=A0A6M0LH03_PSEXY|nr:hypothetical protein [Pseudobutyrivibrio xylanivorans]SFR72013.1 3-oxoacyl-[acyl-carrier-protein] synthase-3 [Pseudobutyrivibrio sp. NOR37]